MEIYLDNAATTRPWPKVVRAVSGVMGEHFGNASSLHRRGLAAARYVSDATDAIVKLVGGGPWKVVYTSGGSESDTTAIKGSAPRGKRNTIVTSSVEHPAVSGACEQMAGRGVIVKTVSVESNGVLNPAKLAAELREDTALVSLVHVAGELGTIQPVEETARLAKQLAPRCRFHVDAVQAVAQLVKLAYPPEVDMVSISAHKLHGPQGIGALLLRPDIQLPPLICGGDQQGGLRPGTLNLPGIVGFGEAARLLTQRRPSDIPAMGERARRFVARVVRENTGVRPLGSDKYRAAGIVVLAVEAVRSEVILHALEARGILASAGSACHSSRSEPSRGLREVGLRRGEGAIRFSLTIDTCEDELEVAATVFSEVLQCLRNGCVGDFQ